MKPDRRGTVQVESYPSSDRLQDGGQGVVLQLEQVRWFTVHLESVGVVVELHWTHKVAVASHHIGELQAEEASVTHRLYVSKSCGESAVWCLTGLRRSFLMSEMSCL